MQSIQNLTQWLCNVTSREESIKASSQTKNYGEFAMENKTYIFVIEFNAVENYDIKL